MVENQQGGGAEPRDESDDGGVLTLVCLTCGKEYFYQSDPPPAHPVCEKCGNKVFRSFDSPEADEVNQDFRDTTERDLSTDQPAADTRPGDLMDLDRG
jgi:predicted  nucleic acid-binding Zn-ribbon protein